MRSAALMLVALAATLSGASAAGPNAAGGEDSEILRGLRQASRLRGEEYLASRDRLIAQAEDKAVRAELATIAEDARADLLTRVLAKRILAAEPKGDEAFYRKLAAVSDAVGLSPFVRLNVLSDKSVLLGLDPREALGLPRPKVEGTGVDVSMYDPSQVNVATRRADTVRME